ncbi:MAG: metallophosphoesterase family protein [Hyphomicrobiaceae bacterium]|nr:metallophosphoesterase family protein [Hyphomicrobiaceae bacterium]
MRLAVIADIHGNCLALEAVLADIAGLGITEILNLGDHLSGWIDPARTADLLMDRPDIVTIAGNQDRRMLEAQRAGTAGARWDCARLSAAHYQWLAAQPATSVHRGKIFLCHGSPLGDEDYWLEDVAPDGRVSLAAIESIEERARGVAASLLLCAHTHVPRSVRLANGRIIVNPGSVGLPAYPSSRPHPHRIETGTPDACYAVVEAEQGPWQVTFRHVPYDRMGAARLAARNGSPVWERALATGWLR